jgi:hypothetical protein
MLKGRVNTLSSLRHDTFTKTNAPNVRGKGTDLRDHITCASNLAHLQTNFNALDYIFQVLPQSIRRHRQRMPRCLSLVISNGGGISQCNPTARLIVFRSPRTFHRLNKEHKRRLVHKRLAPSTSFVVTRGF